MCFCLHISNTTKPAKLHFFLPVSSPTRAQPELTPSPTVAHPDTTPSSTVVLPETTSPPEGNGGVVAGVIVALVVIALVIILVVVIAYFLYR